MGTLCESLNEVIIVIIVIGNCHLRLQLFNHFPCVIRPHCIGSCNGHEQNIDMTDELKLIFIERLPDITRVQDTEAVHFKDKG